MVKCAAGKPKPARGAVESPGTGGGFSGGKQSWERQITSQG